ncbi:MAG: exo-alpha-sialidase [Planctomycetaceae bacterium]|nr:exo-alpha-sialidase [Planctomycetaceae bacterium]
MRPSMSRLTSLWLAVYFVAKSLTCSSAKADEESRLPTAYATYVSSGIEVDGNRVRAWKHSGDGTANRSLNRVVGRPKAVLVQTDSGPRTVVRFDGRSALWSAVGEWGTVDGDRTIVVVAKVSGATGTLLDGSTRTGRAPVRWTGTAWESAAGFSERAISTHVPADTVTPAEVTNGTSSDEWKCLIFRFAAGDGPLGGLIIGADVATQNGLRCDVGEVHVFSTALSDPQTDSLTASIVARWKNAKELPDDQQLKPRRLTDDPDVFRTVVRENGADGVHTYRIPGLATSAKGTLVAVFDVRNKSSADLPGDIDVGMMRSVDDGVTWETMRRIIDFDSAVEGSQGNGVGDPAILVDQRTGKIIVAALWSMGPRAWNASGPGLSPEETGQLVLVTSDDDGLTWSKPRSITAQVKQPEWRLCFNGPGNGIQLRDGTLIFPAQFKQDQPSKETGKIVSTPHSCFIASVDGGETWKISPAAIPDGIPTSECSIAELSNGSLLLSMRDESRSGLRAWARWDWKDSILNGTWSDPWMTVTDPTCMASLIRHPDNVLLFSNPDDSKRRISLTVRHSDDHILPGNSGSTAGRKWSDGRVIDPSGAMYSSMTVLRDGRIGMLYESSEEDGLVFVRFPLDWVSKVK